MLPCFLQVGNPFNKDNWFLTYILYVFPKLKKKVWFFLPPRCYAKNSFQCKWVSLSSWRYYSALNFAQRCLKIFGFAKFRTVLRETTAEAAQTQLFVLPIREPGCFFLYIAVEWLFITDNLLNSGQILASVRSFYSDKIKKRCMWKHPSPHPILSDAIITRDPTLFWVFDRFWGKTEALDVLIMNFLFPQSSQSAPWLGAPFLG